MSEVSALNIWSGRPKRSPRTAALIGRKLQRHPGTRDALGANSKSCSSSCDELHNLRLTRFEVCFDTNQHRHSAGDPAAHLDVVIVPVRIDD